MMYKYSASLTQWPHEVQFKKNSPQQKSILLKNLHYKRDICRTVKQF